MRQGALKPMFVRESVSIGGRLLTFETGRLAKLAHGAVLVTSRAGMTRFTIVLARLAEAEAAVPSAPAEPARTGRR